MAVSPNDDRVLITAEGFEQLHRELERLRTTERRRLAELLREARGDGVLEDNPTLIELLDERGRLEARIAMLEAQLALAEVAPPPRDGAAAIGSIVRGRDVGSGAEFEYELVGAFEGDAANGRVSIAAPIGRALLGRQRGARIEVSTPRSTRTLEVLQVTRRRRAAARRAA